MYMFIKIEHKAFEKKTRPIICSSSVAKTKFRWEKNNELLCNNLISKFMKQMDMQVLEIDLNSLTRKIRYLPSFVKNIPSHREAEHKKKFTCIVSK